MSGESESKKRFRPQFRLATLFWVMLVVASFFAGRSSDELWQRLRRSWEADLPATVTVRVGAKVALTSPSAIRQVQVNNPDLCRVTPLSPSEIQVDGTGVGTTQLMVWQTTSASPKSIQVTVKP